MLPVAGTSARRRKLLSEIERLARVAVFRSLVGNLSHVWTAGLPLPPGRTQAWSAPLYQLSRREGEDHGLLRAERGGGSDAGRNSCLARAAGVFARAGGDE